MQPGVFYHIFNRGNNREDIFLEEENYRFFLQRYKYYLEPFVDTYAYCLMPNHFHFLIQVRGNNSEISEIPQVSVIPPKRELSPLEKAFRDFFKSYAKSYNKKYERSGSLFQTKFKRKPIIENTQLFQLVLYIHHNPVKAGLCTRPEGWPFSSFNGLVGNTPTALKQNEVLEWFGGRRSFIQAHENLNQSNPEFKKFCEF